MTEEPVRIGDVERDRAAGKLRDHLVAGRLTAEEFNSRLDQAMQSRTNDDLRGLFTDLPGGAEVVLASETSPAPVEPEPTTTTEVAERDIDEDPRLWTGAPFVLAGAGALLLAVLVVLVVLGGPGGGAVILPIAALICFVMAGVTHHQVGKKRRQRGV
ncbi:DUF1707 SHOCT-like domain-containing protein [Parenemella sanctibonifatiensis]|uniref:DUF1707 SHOCT-like domain-containing protein n=1 Tax=Parenemella sanctibonifatiensis TaxID=2016505 RepID=UPI0015C62C69|nr:DUF1707 domain-containing protein [Parenemella sanctibonifatiensis]